MAADADGNHEIYIDAMARNIEEKVSGLMPVSPLCCIFRIPITQLRQNLNAYVPDGFSFGPFHHEKENLEHTEMIKAQYLRDLISRLSPAQTSPAQTRLMMIQRFTAAISEKQKEARECYFGPIGMEEDKFVEVLVLDGCFIIELLRKQAYESLREENDPIFSASFLLQFLWHDLILIENQIPWMVLDILFNLTLSPIDEKSLVQLAIDFFGNIVSTKPTQIRRLPSDPSKHILDLLRNSLVLNFSKSKKGENQKMVSFGLVPMPSAKSLRDSGIRIEAGYSESIFDIQFKSNSILEIPTLLIRETTGTLFRNLISLEQCCPNYDPIITSYAVLFDNLMKTKNDVEILSNSGAIYNWLNVDDATRLFNKLYIDTSVKENFYSALTREVNYYCQDHWRRYRRVIVRDYSHDPWTFVSVNVAIIALILTFVQTVFAGIKG